MSIARRDEWLQDAQGRALAGAVVYYCNQPANTSVVPPSPLATVYSDLTGDPATNPQITDGFGHAVAYLDDSVLYTITYNHPLFGPNPVVLKDQSLGGGGGGAGVTPVQASTTEGTITGAIPGSVFVLPSIPLANSLILNANGQVLNPGTSLGPTVGYTIIGALITLYTALQTGDILNANYLVA
jgi:hypothetical protein